MRILVALLMVAVVGCVPKKQQGSATQHDAHSDTNAGYSNQWTKVSDEEFEKFVKQGKKSETLSRDDAMSKRLNFWVEHLSAALVARNPKEFANIPRPEARVVKDKTINAYVSSVKVCTNVIVAKDGIAAAPTDYELYDASGEKFSGQKVGLDECVSRNLGAADVASLADWLFKPRLDCFERIDGNTIYLKASCAPSKPVKFAYHATSNQFVFFSGLLELSTENDAVAVMFHELGHYYKSHVNARAASYNQWYTMDGTQAAKTPKMDAKAKELGERMTKLVNSGVGFESYSEVTGERYYPLTFLALRQAGMADKLVTSCGADSACLSACKAYKATFEDNNDHGTFLFFPWLPLKSGETALFLDQEKQLESCAKLVPASEGPVQASLKAALENMKPVLAKNLPAATESQSFADYLTSLNVFYKSVRAEEKKTMDVVYQEAVDKQLGQYTVEQEADELSLEWQNLLGLNPGNGPAFFVKIGAKLASLDAEHLVGEINPTQCEEYYKNDWKDKDGKPVFIAVADWQDSHHASCFRAFNMSREIAAHRYHTHFHVDYPRPTDGLDWNTLLKALPPGATT